MNEPRVVTVSTGRGKRGQALRELLGRVVELGWLDEAEGRVVMQRGAAGCCELVTGTVESLATALRDRSHVVDVGMPRRVDDDAIAVLGLGGSVVRVPRRWFEPFFLITVVAVHSDRRWRIGAALQAQAEALARLNPEQPAATVLVEAHRMGGADVAIACGTHPTAGEWWAASPNALWLDGALARAAGLDPVELPAIRAVARHELLDPWETAVEIPDLSDLAGGAVGVALDASRERAAAVARRVVEDASRVARNLRKVPPALRRRLAARAGGRKSA